MLQCVGEFAVEICVVVFPATNMSRPVRANCSVLQCVVAVCCCGVLLQYLIVVCRYSVLLQ